MDTTNTEKSSSSGFSSTAEDYRLWAAQNDPMVRAGSDFLVDKMGIAQEISDVLMLVVQRLMGFQNGGVAMANTLQNTAVGIGMPTYVANGGYSGTISGGNVMALNFASKMTEAMQTAFFRSNGAARASAMGLNQNEIAGVMSQLMRAGATHQFGPLGRTEVLNASRIEEIQARARKAGNRRAMHEAELLKEGQLYTGLDEGNMRKFEDYAKKAVKVVSSLKNLLGSSTLEELDAKIQETVGMSLPEFGFDRANALFVKAKAAGITYFGGDTKTALAYMNAGSDMFAQTLAMQMGMDPNDPMVRNAFKGIGATVMSYRGATGIAGGNGQIAESGRLRGAGFDVAATSADQIETTTQEDIGIIGAQETELLAVTSMMQKLGAAATPKQRAAADAAMKALQTADTGDKVIAARAQLASVFNDISGGQSVGDYVGDAANQARLMSQLRGRAKDDFAKTISGARDNRMEQLLADEYANSAYLQEATGLSGSEMGDVGSFIANLTSAQRADLASGNISGVLGNADVQKMMQHLGLSGEALAPLLQKLNANQINMISAAANQFEGTESYVSYGDRQEGNKKQLQDLLRVSASGPAKVTGDTISEFIAGMAGDEELRGGALTKYAIGQGKGTTLEVDATGKMAGTAANFEALMKTKEGKEFLESAGVTADNFEGFMADYENQLNLFNAVTKSGAYVSQRDANGNVTGFSFLTEEEEKEARKGIEADAYTRIIGAFSKKPAGMSQEEWDAEMRKQTERQENETDEDYATRMGRKIRGNFGNWARGIEGSYSGMAAEIANGGEKGERYAYKLMAASDYLTDTQKDSVMEALAAEMGKVEEARNQREASGNMTEEEQAEFANKAERLKTAMDKVRSSMKTQEVSVQRTTTMYVTNLHMPETSKSNSNK